MNPMLRRPFAWSEPDWRPAFGSPVYWAGWIQPQDDGFIDQSANFMGAFGDHDWTGEWTSHLQDSDMRQ